MKQNKNKLFEEIEVKKNKGITQSNLKPGDIVIYPPATLNGCPFGHVSMFEEEDQYGFKFIDLSLGQENSEDNTARYQGSEFIDTLKKASVFRIKDTNTREIFTSLIRSDRFENNTSYMTRGGIKGLVKTVKKLVTGLTPRWPSSKKTASARKLNSTLKSLNKQVSANATNTTALDCSSYIFSRLQMALVFSEMEMKPQQKKERSACDPLVRENLEKIDNLSRELHSKLKNTKKRRIISIKLVADTLITALNEHTKLSGHTDKNFEQCKKLVKQTLANSNDGEYTQLKKKDKDQLIRKLSGVIFEFPDRIQYEREDKKFIADYRQQWNELSSSDKEKLIEKLPEPMLGSASTRSVPYWLKQGMSSLSSKEDMKPVKKRRKNITR